MLSVRVEAWSFVNVDPRKQALIARYLVDSVGKSKGKSVRSFATRSSSSEIFPGKRKDKENFSFERDDLLDFLKLKVFVLGRFSFAINNR